MSKIDTHTKLYPFTCSLANKLTLLKGLELNLYSNKLYGDNFLSHTVMKTCLTCQLQLCE